jgi:hypothetical protein
MTISYARALIEAERSGEQFAGADLADLVEHLIEHPDLTVAAALGLERDDPRRHRDRLLRDLPIDGSSLRKRAAVIQQKVKRYRPRPDDHQKTEDERGILWQLNQAGAPDLSERHIRRILGGK